MSCRRSFESSSYPATFICPDKTSRSAKNFRDQAWSRSCMTNTYNPLFTSAPGAAWLFPYALLLSLLFKNCTEIPVANSSVDQLIAMHGPQHSRVTYDKLVSSVLYSTMICASTNQSHRHMCTGYVMPQFTAASAAKRAIRLHHCR